MTHTQKAEKMEAAAKYHRRAGNDRAAAQATRIAAKEHTAAVREIEDSPAEEAGEGAAMSARERLAIAAKILKSHQDDVKAETTGMAAASALMAKHNVNRPGDAIDAEASYRTAKTLQRMEA